MFVYRRLLIIPICLNYILAHNYYEVRENIMSVTLLFILVRQFITFEGLSTTFQALTNVYFTYFCHIYSLLAVIPNI